MNRPTAATSDQGMLYFHRYCGKNDGQIADTKDEAYERFFVQIDNSRDTYFDSSRRVYTGVVLRDHKRLNTGLVDFAQEGLVAKLHINSPESKPNTVKRKRTRKNAQLREAQAFFEEMTKKPFRAIRIDNVYDSESGEWKVRTVDVTSRK